MYAKKKKTQNRSTNVQLHIIVQLHTDVQLHISVQLHTDVPLHMLILKHTITGRSYV